MRKTQSVTLGGAINQYFHWEHKIFAAGRGDRSTRYSARPTNGPVTFLL